MPSKAMRADAWVISAALAAYLAVSNGLLLLSASLFRGGMPELAELLIETGCYAAGMVAAIAIAARPGDEFCLAPPVGRFGRLAPIMIFAAFFPIQWLSSLLNDLLESAGINSYDPAMAVPTGAPELAVFVLELVVLPAVLEELLFRGAIMGRLRAYGDLFAAVVSSVLFASLHSALYSLPGIFLLAMLFAYADIKTNSLVPSILMHLINNGIAVYSWYVSDSGSDLSSAGFSAGLVTASIISASALAALLITGRLGRGRELALSRGENPLKFFLTLPALLILAVLIFFLTRLTEVAF